MTISMRNNNVLASSNDVHSSKNTNGVQRGSKPLCGILKGSALKCEKCVKPRMVGVRGLLMMAA